MPRKFVYIIHINQGFFRQFVSNEMIGSMKKACLIDKKYCKMNHMLFRKGWADLLKFFKLYSNVIVPFLNIKLCKAIDLSPPPHWCGNSKFDGIPEQTLINNNKIITHISVFSEISIVVTLLYILY